MPAYRRILALLSDTAPDSTAARRAHQLRRLYGATLALATLVDGDCRDEARRELDLQADEIGGNCEIIVGHGAGRDTVCELLHSWSPDLAVVDAAFPYGLEDCGAANTPCDVLIVRRVRRSLGSRLINALAAPL